MGYHDLSPVAFLVSDAVRETNTAEDAALYDQWLRKNHERLYGKKNSPPTKATSFSAKTI